MIKTIDEMCSAKFVVTGRRFSELLGRLGFAAQAVPWLRPLLGAFYARDGVLSPFMAARAPALVVLTMGMILERFKEGDFTSHAGHLRGQQQRRFGPTPSLSMGGSCWAAGSWCIPIRHSQHVGLQSRLIPPWHLGCFTKVWMHRG